MQVNHLNIEILPGHRLEICFDKDCIKQVFNFLNFHFTSDMVLNNYDLYENEDNVDLAKIILHSNEEDIRKYSRYVERLTIKQCAKTIEYCPN